MNIRPVFFITCVACITGCVKSTASINPVQAHSVVNGIAASPPPGSTKPTRKLVKTVKEDTPQMAAETLPNGTFRIDRRLKDEVPRVELIMLDGPAKGDRFTCNLITGPYPSFSLAPECSGEKSSVDASCVNRGICFSAFECSCEANDKGLPEIPLQNTHN